MKQVLRTLILLWLMMGSLSLAHAQDATLRLRTTQGPIAKYAIAAMQAPGYGISEVGISDMNGCITIPIAIFQRFKNPIVAIQSKDNPKGFIGFTLPLNYSKDTIDIELYSVVFHQDPDFFFLNGGYVETYGLSQFWIEPTYNLSYSWSSVYDNFVQRKIVIDKPHTDLYLGDLIQLYCAIDGVAVRNQDFAGLGTTDDQGWLTLINPHSNTKISISFNIESIGYQGARSFLTQGQDLKDSVLLFKQKMQFWMDDTLPTFYEYSVPWLIDADLGQSAFYKELGLNGYVECYMDARCRYRAVFSNFSDLIPVQRTDVITKVPMFTFQAKVLANGRPMRPGADIWLYSKNQIEQAQMSELTPAFMFQKMVTNERSEVRTTVFPNQKAFLIRRNSTAEVNDISRAQLFDLNPKSHLDTIRLFETVFEVILDGKPCINMPITLKYHGGLSETYGTNNAGRCHFWFGKEGSFEVFINYQITKAFRVCHTCDTLIRIDLSSTQFILDAQGVANAGSLWGSNGTIKMGTDALDQMNKYLNITFDSVVDNQAYLRTPASNHDYVYFKNLESGSRSALIKDISNPKVVLKLMEFDLQVYVDSVLYTGPFQTSLFQGSESNDEYMKPGAIFEGAYRCILHETPASYQKYNILLKTDQAQRLDFYSLTIFSPDTLGVPPEYYVSGPNIQSFYTYHRRLNWLEAGTYTVEYQGEKTLVEVGPNQPHELWLDVLECDLNFTFHGKKKPGALTFDLHQVIEDRDPFYLRTFQATDGETIRIQVKPGTFVLIDDMGFPSPKFDIDASTSSIALNLTKFNPQVIDATGQSRKCRRIELRSADESNASTAIIDPNNKKELFLWTGQEYHITAIGPTIFKPNMTGLGPAENGEYEEVSTIKIGTEEQIKLQIPYQTLVFNINNAIGVFPDSLWHCLTDKQVLIYVTDQNGLYVREALVAESPQNIYFKFDAYRLGTSLDWFVFHNYPAQEGWPYDLKLNKGTYSSDTITEELVKIPVVFQEIDRTTFPVSVQVKINGSAPDFEIEVGVFHPNTLELAGFAITNDQGICVLNLPLGTYELQTQFGSQLITVTADNNEVLFDLIRIHAKLSSAETQAVDIHVNIDNNQVRFTKTNEAKELIIPAFRDSASVATFLNFKELGSYTQMIPLSLTKHSIKAGDIVEIPLYKQAFTHDHNDVRKGSSQSLFLASTGFGTLNKTQMFPISDIRKATHSVLLPQGTYELFWLPFDHANLEKINTFKVTAQTHDTVRLRTYDTYVKITNASGETRSTNSHLITSSNNFQEAPSYTLVEGVTYSLYCQDIRKKFSVHSKDTVTLALPWYKRKLQIIDPIDGSPLPYAPVLANGHAHVTDHQGQITLNDVTSPLDLYVEYPNYISYQQTLFFAHSGSNTIALTRNTKTPYRVNFQWIQDGLALDTKKYTISQWNDDNEHLKDWSSYNNFTLFEGQYRLDLEQGQFPFSVSKDTTITLNARTLYLSYSNNKVLGDVPIAMADAFYKQDYTTYSVPSQPILLEGRYLYHYGNKDSIPFVLDKDHTHLVLPVATATFKLTEAGKNPSSDRLISLSGASHKTLIYRSGLSNSHILAEGNYSALLNNELFHIHYPFKVEKDRNTEVDLRLNEIKISYSAKDPRLENQLYYLKSLSIRNKQGFRYEVIMNTPVNSFVFNDDYVIEGYHYRRNLKLKDTSIQIPVVYVNHRITPVTTRHKIVFPRLPIQSLKQRGYPLEDVDLNNYLPFYVENEPYELTLSFKGLSYSKPFLPRNNGNDTLWIPTNEVKFDIKSSDNAIANAEVLINLAGIGIDGALTNQTGFCAIELPNHTTYHGIIHADGYRSQEFTWSNGSNDTLISIKLQNAQPTLLSLQTRDGQSSAKGRIAVLSQNLTVLNKEAKLNSPVELNLPKGTYTIIWKNDQQMAFRKEIQITEQAQTIPWVFNTVTWNISGNPMALKFELYDGVDSTCLIDEYLMSNNTFKSHIPDGHYLYSFSGEDILSPIYSVNLTNDRVLNTNYYSWTAFVRIDDSPAINAWVILKNDFDEVSLKTDENGMVRHFATNGTYQYSVQVPSFLQAKSGTITLNKSDTSYIDFSTSIPLTPYLLRFTTTSQQAIANAQLSLHTVSGDHLGNFDLGMRSKLLIDLPSGQYRFGLIYGDYPFSYGGNFTVGNQADSLLTIIPMAHRLDMLSMDRDDNPIPCFMEIQAAKDQSGYKYSDIDTDDNVYIFLSPGNYPYWAESDQGERIHDTIRMTASNSTYTIRWKTVPYYDLSITTLSGDQPLSGVIYRIRHADSAQAITGQLSENQIDIKLASGTYYVELSKTYYQTLKDTLVLRQDKNLSYQLKALILNNKVSEDTLCPEVSVAGRTLIGSQAEAAHAITYQWQKASQSQGQWANLSTGQNYTLTISDLETHLYRRIATTTHASDTSNLAQIRRISVDQHFLVPDLQTISFDNQPQVIQEHAQFEIQNDRPSIYSWFARTPSADSSWSAINSASQASYQPGNMKKSQDFKRRVLTAKGCAFESSPASIHVRDSITVILPSVSIVSSSDITDSTVSLASKVLDNGGAEISEVGFYHSTQASPNFSSLTPTRADLKTDQTFKVTVKHLQPGTVYYAWSYAINSEGRKISESSTFTTANTVGIQPVREAFITLSPNPNSGVIRIDYEGYTLRNIYIRTIDGRNLLYWGQSSIGTSGFQLQHSLKAGMYILVMDTDQGMVLRKLNVLR